MNILLKESEMKISKHQLKKIIKEEYSKIIEEYGHYNRYSSRRGPIATYGQRIKDAERNNDLPPVSSNWHAFAKKMDIGVLDLNNLAADLGYKSFAHMDAAASPRGLSDMDVDDVVESMREINGANEIDVLDALSLPYGG